MFNGFAGSHAAQNIVALPNGPASKTTTFAKPGAIAIAASISRQTSLDPLESKGKPSKPSRRNVLQWQHLYNSQTDIGSDIAGQITVKTGAGLQIWPETIQGVPGA